MTKLKITQLKSPIGSKPTVRDTLRTLGLNKINQTAIREDIPSVRGALQKVAHLVSVEEVE